MGYWPRNFFLSIVLLVIVFNCVHGLNKDTKYTPQEKQALKEFKVAIKEISNKDYHKLDSHLIHYLRKKNLNIGEAKQFFQETLQWRKDNSIDLILQNKEMIALENNTFPFTLNGLDKDKRPILTYVLKKWDVRRFVLSGKSDIYRRFHLYIIEKATQRINDLALEGKDVSQFLILTDLSGFNSRQHSCLPCLQGLGEMIPLLDLRYYGTSFQTIFVNAPRVFSTVVAFIKPLITGPGRDAIFVFGYDKYEWRKHLSELIDDNQLSPDFGGTQSH